jgi:hypothetical protein
MQIFQRVIFLTFSYSVEYENVRNILKLYIFIWTFTALLFIEEVQIYTILINNCYFFSVILHASNR